MKINKRKNFYGLDICDVVVFKWTFDLFNLLL